MCTSCLTWALREELQQRRVCARKTLRVLLAYRLFPPSDCECSVQPGVRATGVSGAGLRLTSEGGSWGEM